MEIGGWISGWKRGRSIRISFSAKAPCIGATSIDRSVGGLGEINGLSFLLLAKLRKIVHASLDSLRYLPSALCTIRAKLERPPFEIPIFSHFFFPQNQYPSFQPVPDDKRNEFLEPSQFDFASKSKQAIGGMLKT